MFLDINSWWFLFRRILITNSVVTLKSALLKWRLSWIYSGWNFHAVLCKEDWILVTHIFMKNLGLIPRVHLRQSHYTCSWFTHILLTIRKHWSLSSFILCLRLSKLLFWRQIKSVVVVWNYLRYQMPELYCLQSQCAFANLFF
jgi:hypothetical protein